MRKSKIYALYKGEDCLGIGTIKELAEQLNIKATTLRFYMTPTYKKRVKDEIDRRVLIRVE